MVADIAISFDRSGCLSSEFLLYCLIQTCIQPVCPRFHVRVGDRIFANRGDVFPREVLLLETATNYRAP